MKFELTPEEIHKAKFPHELFLTNMIGNHILWFVAALGTLGAFWQPLALVPVVSIGILAYTLWRARRARQMPAEEGWYLMCQWQIVARRSRGFIYMLCLLATIASLGGLAHLFLGMKKVAVLAFIGGVGLLPVLVSVLGLIVMESDALHQVAQGKLSARLFALYPNPEAVILEDDSEQAGEGEETEADHQQGGGTAHHQRMKQV